MNTRKRFAFLMVLLNSIDHNQLLALLNIVAHMRYVEHKKMYSSYLNFQHDFGMF